MLPHHYMQLVYLTMKLILFDLVNDDKVKFVSHEVISINC